MVVRHHRFFIASSLKQTLALWLLACVCLMSFLAWPQVDLFWYQFCRVLGFLSVLGFFSYQQLLLRQFKCEFSLNELGEGRFTNGQCFRLKRHAWVTPIGCFFYIKEETSTRARLIILWSDMLNESDYRCLCRLLRSHCMNDKSDVSQAVK